MRKANITCDRYMYRSTVAIHVLDKFYLDRKWAARADGANHYFVTLAELYWDCTGETLWLDSGTIVHQQHTCILFVDIEVLFLQTIVY